MPITRRQAISRLSLLLSAAAAPAGVGCGDDDTKAKPGSDTATDADVEADTGVQADTGFEPDTAPDAEADTAPDAEADTEADTEGDTEADTGLPEDPTADLEDPAAVLDNEPLPEGLPVYAHEGDLGPESLFAHGVASGDPLPDRIILWTRVTVPGVDEVPVFFEIADDEAFSRRRNAGWLSATAERDFTVKVDASGLHPGKRYYYRFMALGRTSGTGRTKSAAADDATRLRFAVVSCASYSHGYFHGYRQIATRANLDAVLHLGDYIYEYASNEYGNVRPYEPAWECVSLEDYRLRYAHYRRDPDCAAMHAAHAMIAVWDDHETANNAWFGGAENHDEVTEGPWADRRTAGERAYFEWMPLREQEDGRIFRTLRYGNLAELIMLDTRLWGRDEQAGLDEVASFIDPLRTLLGSDQEDWLAGRLRGADVRWKVIGQQVMMGQWRSPGSGGMPGPIFNSDQWDGYDATRSRLFGVIETARVDNVVVLTGDIHSSWALDLTRNPYDVATYDPATGDGSIAVEFVTPAISSPGFPRGIGENLAVNLKRANPHMRFVELVKRGYLVLELTEEFARGSWYHFNDVVRETATQSRAAVVTAYEGRNRLVVEG
jgi:alkaline phosphatase D